MGRFVLAKSPGSMDSDASSSTQASASSAHKVAKCDDLFQLDFVPQPSGDLALFGPSSEKNGLFVIGIGAEGTGWSRVLYQPNEARQANKPSMKGQVSGLRLVGSVNERELRLDGNSVDFKSLYRTRFYSSKATFTGLDGCRYRWQLGSAFKGDDLHLVDALTSDVVLQFLRPDQGPHQLVFTTRSAPMMEFLILSALQRVWALGLASPEAGTYALAELIGCADADELAFW